MCQDRTKYVCLTVAEGWLNRFENIWNISFERSKWFLVYLDATKAGFSHISDHFADSRYEELRLYVRKNLEEVTAMS